MDNWVFGYLGIWIFGYTYSELFDYQGLTLRAFEHLLQGLLFAVQEALRWVGLHKIEVAVLRFELLTAESFDKRKQSVNLLFVFEAARNELTSHWHSETDFDNTGPCRRLFKELFLDVLSIGFGLFQINFLQLRLLSFEFEFLLHLIIGLLLLILQIPLGLPRTLPITLLRILHLPSSTTTPILLLGQHASQPIHQRLHPLPLQQPLGAQAPLRFRLLIVDVDCEARQHRWGEVWLDEGVVGGVVEEAVYDEVAVLS